MNAPRISAHDDVAGDGDDIDDREALEHDGPSRDDDPPRKRRAERAQDAADGGRIARRTNQAQDAEPKSHGYDASQRPRRTQRAQDAQKVPHPHAADVAQDASS